MARETGATSRIRATGWHARIQGTLSLVLLLAFTGCGTTRCTDTSRTATEQLLVSNSVDQAISEMDFTPLAGKAVFFEDKYLDGVTDKGYIISSLRQHLLASGCLLQEDRPKATYVVEARAGSVGTDRKELLFGVPQMNVPSVVPGQPAGPLPEIPLAKHTDRRGVAKIAVFAYNRTTGSPVWQSGVVQRSSTAKDTWMFGAGPWEAGTLYDGTKLAGQPVQIPLAGEPHEGEAKPAVVPVTQAAYWSDQSGPQLGTPAPPPAKPGEPSRFPLPPSGPVLPVPDPTPRPTLSLVTEKDSSSPAERKPQFQTTKDANGGTSITVVPRTGN